MGNTGLNFILSSPSPHSEAKKMWWKRVGHQTSSNEKNTRTDRLYREGFEWISVIGDKLSYKNNMQSSAKYRFHAIKQLQEMATTALQTVFFLPTLKAQFVGINEHRHRRNQFFFIWRTIYRIPSSFAYTHTRTHARLRAKIPPTANTLWKCHRWFFHSITRTIGMCFSHPDLFALSFILSPFFLLCFSRSAVQVAPLSFTFISISFVAFQLPPICTTIWQYFHFIP